jgi:TPR repeat protein
MQLRPLLAASLVMMLAGCTPAATTPEKPLTETGSNTRPKLSYDDVLARANDGDHYAEFELGAMYHDGDGVDQDYAQSLSWFKKAAQGGNRQAAFNLGLMYKNGEGTKEDMTAARGWFIRASDAGDVRAALQLGTMAYVEKDYAKARDYFLKAAKGGLAEGEMNAGVLYIRGEGVSQDFVEGYAWLKIAKEAGNARASSLFETLKAQITSEQITKGDARAEELKKEIKK